MERYFPGATMTGNVLSDDIRPSGRGVGADVTRLTEMADAVPKGVPPGIGGGIERLR